jgi:hypothetical protein
MVHAAWDSEEEARAIGEEIEQAQIKGRALNNMAILVRASFQMREFEERFVTLGLNYRVIGGPRFYERQEIRDAMAFFRVVCQPADDLAFERIVNVPKRGLGEAAVRQVHDVARARGIPMLAAARELILTDELKPKPRKSLTDVVEMFTRWQGMLESTPGHELAETILEESGYTEMWQNDRSADAPTRLENLKELVETISGFESMRAFLEHVALVMDTDNNPDLDAVSIMTLHSAKGLEFETVFLPGWEEGLFPHQRALDEGGRSGLEEERRLAYVGLTRAKRHCHIWFVSNRRIHGLWQSTLPSRFLDELPEAHVEVAEMDTGYGGYGRGGPLRRIRRPLRRPLRRLALRQGRTFRRQLQHARLETRPGQQDRRRPRQLGHPLRPRRRTHCLRRKRPARLHHRRRTRRQIHRHDLRLLGRRPRLPPQIRQRQHRLHRRQQADHRFRQGRAEAGAGRVCGAGGVGLAVEDAQGVGQDRGFHHRDGRAVEHGSARSARRCGTSR